MYNDIILLFPILTYYFFFIYNQNVNKERKEVLFDISVIVSLFLTVNSVYHNNYFKFTFLVIILMISFFNNKTTLSLVVSFISIEYSVTELHFSFIYTILFFFSMFILFYIYSKKKIHSDIFISISAIDMFGFFFIVSSYVYSNLIYSVISIVVYLINIRLVLLFMRESKNIMNLHMSIKEFQESKDFKNNLFKITHEVKNPLAVIKGYLDMFDVNDKNKSTRYINIIKGEVCRSLNLLDDFKEFSKLSINKKEVNINLLFEEIKNIMASYFVSNKVRAVYKIEKNIKIYADYDRLKQVIINVLKNSIEACSENKIVLTTVFIFNDTLFIYVKDNGKGMDSDTLDNIMNPFFTTKENGTGLGTSISNEIVKAHEGAIRYRSKIDEGTTCLITINNSIDNKDMGSSLV